MKRFLMLVMTIGVFCACESSEDKATGQEADRERLEKMKQEILDRIEAVPCENAEDWKPEGLGSKACGGPQQYVPYPQGADESGELLEMIKNYTELEKAYNEKYHIISDCRAIAPPEGVHCEDGKAVLDYKTLSPDNDK